MNQGFNTVQVGVRPLVDKLIENRKIHIAAHEAACVAFKETAAMKLRKRAGEVENGDTTNLNFSFSAPVSHEEEYDDVIAMLEFSLATAGELREESATIELDRDQCRNYIQDKWNWTHQWGMAISGYCGLQ